MALQVKDGGCIIIINVYRVTQNTGTKAGPSISYMRQYGALRMEGKTCPESKRQVFKDIPNVIQEWKTEALPSNCYERLQPRAWRQDKDMV